MINFNEEKKGYNKEQVMQYINTLGNEYKKALAEIEKLKKELEAAKSEAPAPSAQPPADAPVAAAPSVVVAPPAAPAQYAAQPAAGEQNMYAMPQQQPVNQPIQPYPLQAQAPVNQQMPFINSQMAAAPVQAPPAYRYKDNQDELISQVMIEAKNYAQEMKIKAEKERTEIINRAYWEADNIKKANNQAFENLQRLQDYIKDFTSMSDSAEKDIPPAQQYKPYSDIYNK
ncbi:MAG: hypothetical protein FWF08_02805 [Oscillospiraceae bacterium]|nr:hypothetical protein [Oscillospiraceae bacterium]